MKGNIGFIGTGNMGSAMIGGLIAKGEYREEQIYVSDLNSNSLEKLKARWPEIQSSTDNCDTVRNADIIVIAVKPHIYSAVISEISPIISDRQIVITIAAGVTIAGAEQMFGRKVKIIRTMPNTPALVGQGVTAYCCNEYVSGDEESSVIPILESFGIVEKVGEEYFHAVIAVSGSSPAYVFMIIEAMADAAVLQGLPRDKAYRMASQAVLGAAAMVRDTGTHPAALKDAVCSPGGTTIEAVRTLEERGIRSALIEAMNNCAEKSKEMTKG